MRSIDYIFICVGVTFTSFFCDVCSPFFPFKNTELLVCFLLLVFYILSMLILNLHYELQTLHLSLSLFFLFSTWNILLWLGKVLYFSRSKGIQPFYHVFSWYFFFFFLTFKYLIHLEFFLVWNVRNGSNLISLIWIFTYFRITY